MHKKILTIVGITILFLGVAIVPSISALVDKDSTESFVNPIIGKTVEITVSRYKADSTIKKTKVILSREKALEFNERYKNTDDSEKRFLLLKEYGLIPEDVTKEQLQQEMLNLSEELGITDEKIKSISERFANKKDDTRWIGINFLNEVGGFTFVSFNLPIGLSLITGILNWGDFLIPSVDLLYIEFYFMGEYLFTNGILPDFYTNPFGFFSLLGFIGFVFSSPFLGFLAGMEGFTVASLVIGPICMGLPWIRS